MQFLGNTLEQIAFEKAGIIKTNIPVVIGETQKETKPVFIEVANKNNSDITFADQDVLKPYESDLKGTYQFHNIKTVIQTLKKIPKGHFNVSIEQIKSGLLRVIKNTGLRGRWETLQLNPKIICDTAHNKEGLSYVLKQLLDEDFQNLHIVFGVVNDKNLNSILPMMPKQAQYYFCKPNIERGLNAEKLRQIFNDHGLKGNAFSSVVEALFDAKSKAELNDLIYIGGSTFVVAEII